MPALAPCEVCRGDGEAVTLPSTCCHVSGQYVPNPPYRLLPSTLERMATPVSARFTSAALLMACVLLRPWVSVGESVVERAESGLR